MADSFFDEHDTLSKTNIKPREPDTVTLEADPLRLDLKEEDLIRVINAKIKAANDFYKNELKLSERRKKNFDYLLGDQIDETRLKYYQAKYVDNVIYEAEGTIKPIALSRLPDLLVKPGNPSDESKRLAEDLTKLVNSDIRRRENRRILSLGFKHLPIYFISCLKAIWDPQLGDNGDYRFKVVHPDNLVVDHTAATNKSEDMEFIAEATEMSVKEVTMKFPKKEKDFLEELKFTEEDKGDEKRMASKVKIWEVWFTWWNSAEDDITGEKKWQRIEGVIWKYKNCVLAKMRNPYWDWQGKKRLFRYELGEKTEPEEGELALSLFEEQENLTENIYFYNFFSDPAKPYYFMGYDQWGQHPIDVTSRVEQVLLMQDNINKRGKQITEINDRAKGKHVFSTDSGLKKDDIEKLDFDNPDQDILIEGDIGNVHQYISSEAAPVQLYQEQESERQKAFAKMGTHSTTRGERKPGPSETATGHQLLRESDYGRIDDLTEETINPAAEWMAKWAMQFIKLFYRKEHLRKLLGQDGEVVFTKITQDSVEDGQEVIVAASGVDKIERKTEAYERAKMEKTDPLTFFIDTDASDPIGRTEKLLIYQMSPELYYQKYVLKRDIPAMGQALQQEPITTGGQPGMMPGMASMAGGVPPMGGGGDKTLGERAKEIGSKATDILFPRTKQALTRDIPQYYLQQSYTDVPSQPFTQRLATDLPKTVPMMLPMAAELGMWGLPAVSGLPGGIPGGAVRGGLGRGGIQAAEEISQLAKEPTPLGKDIDKAVSKVLEGAGERVKRIGKEAAVGAAVGAATTAALQGAGKVVGKLKGKITKPSAPTTPTPQLQYKPGEEVQKYYTNGERWLHSLIEQGKSFKELTDEVTQTGMLATPRGSVSVSIDDLSKVGRRLSGLGAIADIDNALQNKDYLLASQIYEKAKQLASDPENPLYKKLPNYADVIRRGLMQAVTPSGPAATSQLTPEQEWVKYTKPIKENLMDTIKREQAAKLTKGWAAPWRKTIY